MADRVAAHAAWCPALERINPRHTGADNQRVDVVRTFVGLHAFEVHEMPHDGVVIRHASLPEYLVTSAHTQEPSKHCFSWPSRYVGAALFRRLSSGPPAARVTAPW